MGSLDFAFMDVVTYGNFQMIQDQWIRPVEQFIYKSMA